MKTKIKVKGQEEEKENASYNKSVIKENFSLTLRLLNAHY
jgi:hypothetical protein